MTEYLLRNKAKEYFTQHFQGKIVRIWFPSKVKWKIEIDIFGCWDGVCQCENKIIFFQLTTISNKSARLKKIVNIMLPNHLYFSKPNEGWLMCWRKKQKKFEIFKI